MFCNSCGTEVSEFARVCPNCGEPTVKVETRAVLGTKWADFLGYFYFWIGCLFGLIGIARLVQKAHLIVGCLYYAVTNIKLISDNLVRVVSEICTKLGAVTFFFPSKF
ncbi:zinc-ribbon domain-containing protein [Pseudobutyrivibrio ruminis]|uniref:zinc-ribbon domain-containing protein n=1 Tax=Pseudobutyrivibrio ruminis TaxID=46206 RepID=UPI00117AC20F